MEKLYKKEKYPNRIEWLKNRGAFGGSTASALFGVNPYLSKLDIYCAAINPNVNEQEDDNENESQRYGTKAEEHIREIVKLNLAKKFKLTSPNGFTLYRRIDRPYQTATLDGVLTELETGRKFILEIKTHDVRGKDDLENWQLQLPQNYFVQGLHYLSVLNDFVGVLFVCKLRYIDYDTGLPRTARTGDGEVIRYYWLEKDKCLEDIEYVEKIETEFYENHIAKHIPPNIEINL